MTRMWGSQTSCATLLEATALRSEAKTFPLSLTADCDHERIGSAPMAGRECQDGLENIARPARCDERDDVRCKRGWNHSGGSCQRRQSLQIVVQQMHVCRSRKTGEHRRRRPQKNIISRRGRRRDADFIAPLRNVVLDAPVLEVPDRGVEEVVRADRWQRTPFHGIMRYIPQRGLVPGISTLAPDALTAKGEAPTDVVDLPFQLEAGVAHQASPCAVVAAGLVLVAADLAPATRLAAGFAHESWWGRRRMTCDEA